jgi:hypothetical protein
VQDKAILLQAEITKLYDSPSVSTLTKQLEVLNPEADALMSVVNSEIKACGSRANECRAQSTIEILRDSSQESSTSLTQKKPDRS